MPALSEPVDFLANELSCGTVGERAALVERVTSSSAFGKSVRMRDFLRYVGHRAARLDGVDVHEQEIGENVFGRARGYDRGDDNIVRVSASDLRKRVNAYFANEGADEPIIFTIPRGSYMPVFQPRLKTAMAEKQETETQEVETQETRLGAAEASKPPVLRNLGRSLNWMLLSLVVVLGSVCVWQNTRLHKSGADSVREPTVDAFWGPMVRSSRQTDIVLSDDSISVEEEITGKRIDFTDYTDRNLYRPLDGEKLSTDRLADLHNVLGHNLVTLGGVYAALRIHDLAPQNPLLHIAWARFYTADALKQDNVILIGGAKANPWVGLFDSRLNFKFDYDNPSHSLVIKNSHPEAGESNSFRPGEQSASYAVVAYLPNPSNTGSVILLLGSDSDATNAAAEYLTSEYAMSTLLQTLQRRRPFPHFELLLKVVRVRGTSLTSELLSYRTYP